MQPVLTTARRRRGKRPAIAIKVTHTHYTLLAHTRREYTHDLTRSSASDRTCQHSPETVHTRSTYTVEEFIFNAWNSLPECYSEVKKLAFGVLEIVGSTYSCEQALSCMNTIKNKWTRRQTACKTGSNTVQRPDPTGDRIRKRVNEAHKRCKYHVIKPRVGV
ncbi:general transcription factor II-I repeat domain-containing protein 2B-like [Aphis craccivora]|uniref:General transcription factor II-I repeat domain-containing protein 2B-like n=1 Tax=Aphis craccivora TaxID=307492 RepID=A0A6G0Z519_APHCR|nr:general transcription factor II-I repeat domain-containing protein 2B-like [Aphis craccivora]